MERRKFIGALSFAGILGTMMPGKILAANKTEQDAYANNDREYWYKLLYKIAGPVVHNLANGTLIKNMPLEKGLEDTRRLATEEAVDALPKVLIAGSAHRGN